MSHPTSDSRQTSVHGAAVPPSTDEATAGEGAHGKRKADASPAPNAMPKRNRQESQASVEAAASTGDEDETEYDRSLRHVWGIYNESRPGSLICTRCLSNSVRCDGKPAPDSPCSRCVEDRVEDRCLPRSVLGELDDTRHALMQHVSMIEELVKAIDAEQERGVMTMDPDPVRAALDKMRENALDRMAQIMRSY
ncbi:hypothetical protein PUNSTDRAFT_139411 [Punctularia strigosozonata HHB-11173 SS5]|uniref:Zn(2)-C6 fungal-type domain-containing protein n=1 Tax=Punctularia strigosozonata (strain HHB-11173) TaxID=741275 RepID=R7RZW7_PUNST|nr:uncharacterized protein PUNSTDRAFT_139411 [Punctularia strigosozonata HHB-11173 SS5]EIN03528.1 hypothetical protein PUNSTDRAFT_139411 [Punctularia strigosozonata HHB-11173 SS5]